MWVTPLWRVTCPTHLPLSYECLGMPIPPYATLCCFAHPGMLMDHKNVRAVLHKGTKQSGAIVVSHFFHIVLLVISMFKEYTTPIPLMPSPTILFHLIHPPPPHPSYYSCYLVPFCAILFHVIHSCPPCSPYPPSSTFAHLVPLTRIHPLALCHATCHHTSLPALLILINLPSSMSVQVCMYVHPPCTISPYHPAG